MRTERNIERGKPIDEEAAERLAKARAEAPQKVVKNVRRLNWRRKLREEAYPEDKPS